MTVHLVTDDKIAETSSKGNQEKWFDREANRWYKLDQFGYEALAECAASRFLEQSNIERDTPFTFVQYDMERLNVHGRDRNGCSSENFLKQGQSLITLSHLFSRETGSTLKTKLEALPSDKRRIAYMADMAAELTGLREFPRYLTLLFEVDALFLNDDRHLNNIAVLYENGGYSYCPIFDNGAGLLSNTQMLQMDIAAKALIASLRSRPLGISFTRQMSTARSLYGAQLVLPKLSREQIKETISPMLDYYAARDRGIILDRVSECVLTMQRKISR